MVATGLSAFIGTILTPEDAGKIISAAYPAVGAIVGAIIGFAIVFAMNFFLAPYRQRNEARAKLQARPKPTPLPNRKELKEAIALLENKTTLLVGQQDIFMIMREQSGYTINSDTVKDRDTAYTLWNDAMNKLRIQYLVAGEPYENICIQFTDFVWIQVASKMEYFKPPEDHKPIVLKDKLQFAGVLGSKAREALRKIDEVSGLAPDKEGSQT